MTPVVDILLLRYRNMPQMAEFAAHKMVARARQGGINAEMPLVYGSALVERARNIALQRIRPEATHVLFYDDDMVPEEDALERLLARNVPVVSALCTTRDHFPLSIAAKAYDATEDRFVPISDVNPEALLMGKFGVGAAFLLMEIGILNQLKEYHLSGRDWLEENRRLLDRLHARNERRERERARIEALRRELYSHDPGTLRIFQRSMQDNQLERGEDIHISRMLIGLGIPIAIDCTVQVLHVGEFGYGPYLLGINDKAELRMTA